MAGSKGNPPRHKYASTQSRAAYLRQLGEAAVAKVAKKVTKGATKKAGRRK